MNDEHKKKLEELIRRLDEKPKAPKDIFKKLGFTVYSNLEEALEASRQKQEERDRRIEQRKKMSETPFIAETSFHVRYAETDAQQIVHHAAYIVYFEEGRSEYLRQQGTSYATFEKSGFYLAVTEVSAKYVKASRYDDKLTVRCWVAQARSRTIQFEYEIIHSESSELRVTGMSKHICLNHEGQIARMPESWQQWV